MSLASAMAALILAGVAGFLLRDLTRGTSPVRLQRDQDGLVRLRFQCPQCKSLGQPSLRASNGDIVSLELANVECQCGALLTVRGGFSFTEGRGVHPRAPE